ncbi:hypothetical protein, partial [Micromonospora sp. NPDC051296]|uniref:endonuclease/exonuclease/phosphatase family protein n=1 Tax=Micromonospora sp. NPDC051296 TaxID=3155046 RepID=UPI00341CF676
AARSRRPMVAAAVRWGPSPSMCSMAARRTVGSGLGDDLTEPADAVKHRIDMVLVRGAVVPVSSEVFGTERRTPDGRWPSDHLGYLATVALP